MNEEPVNDEIKVDLNRLRSIDFYMLVVASVMIALGIGIGSFIQGTIALAVFGSFLFMLGIVIYIIIEFKEA